MYIKYVLILLIITCLNSSGIAQIDSKRLEQPMQLSQGDYLEMRLYILAAQLSSGSYIVHDLGPRLEFHVKIALDAQNRILIEITGKLDQSLSEELLKNSIEPSMYYVECAINLLMRYDFPQINFDKKSCIIGFWYCPMNPKPIAKWENGEVFLLK